MISGTERTIGSDQRKHIESLILSYVVILILEVVLEVAAGRTAGVAAFRILVKSCFYGVSAGPGNRQGTSHVAKGQGQGALAQRTP